MQLTTFVVAALAGIAFAVPQAQVTDCPATSAIPSCGMPCISSAASAAGCSDMNCRCSKSAVIQASALNCVLGNCGLETALKVRSAAAAACTACT
ncbi:uncharacterized protein E0L32_002325 [Thyridium curvatum]|uniref:CFEM domain-containing protein n=1 Tax=Thyridium curvatum TaxID=1093900 RepID=A0A507APR4_9PEZI|nr:uncharacterized protein E0L32_002325 [Thyridium curvatum]TPX06829.1 hypothetical protein E0L32_002325 [Thyridium curvatum]